MSDGGGRAAEGKSLPNCPDCGHRLAIRDPSTFVCYHCLQWYDRDGVGEVGA